ncbi:hypothetical protein P7228_13435 [Altererythrobacter arenosus]|uniref:DUF3618 domain-containing protein n=1 Tax=Altererythrobacter arenosus TaxID=3032592 RepID=A0ABY8FSV3_9SPHN|nr:hypothetical protein [Altererythrobacter sp. CAU 1644]WFL76983.1 hypothetical protein P7228_13435 [Altererythrobacter sp. CAU 1644]
MADLKRQMQEDRALRDAARALLDADVAHLRNGLASKSIGERVLDNIGEGAKDVFESAADAADNHKGALAALIGAIVLWFARNPIMSLFFDDEEDDQARPREREQDQARS